MKKILIIVMAIALMAAGCQEIKNIRLPGIDYSEEPTGKSLNAYFVNPKDNAVVLSKYRFQPVVRIRNLGGSESEGQTCIFGIDGKIFSGFESCECQTFQQAKDESEKFEPEDLEFGAYTIHIAKGDRKDYTLSSVTRFEYGNEIKAGICISGDVYENRGCTATLNSATAGPLVINRIEQVTIADPDNKRNINLLFKIQATKAGYGRFIPESSVNGQCNPISPDEAPKIKARAKGFPTTAPVTCEDTEIKGDGVTVICEVNNLDVADFGEGYTTEVTFELRYFFETTSSSRFTVQ
ncbi:MAG: hypothetical protein QME12_03205 [Nanoarchaeota archaeon]|nr:hypothetical protein [Nanoarchaeota archaeon]